MIFKLFNKKGRASRPIVKSNLSNKRNFELKIKSIYFKFKIGLLVILTLFFFTNFFDPFKQYIYNSFDSWLRAKQILRYEDLIIQGRPKTDVNEIINAISAEKGSNILNINIKIARQKLLNLPWVKNAVVEKRLPSTIYVALLERKPIALWQFNNKVYLIDEEGERITANYNESEFQNYIYLVGENANIYARKLISNLQVHEDLKTRVRAALRFGNRRWDLVLDQNITIKMPEINFDKAYDYINKLHKKGKLFDNNYRVIDLRNNNTYFFETDAK